ncbi:inositol monophosphatase family protein [Streptomyces sp. NPDC058307]|uniref:inositol monophosphatase family protein n=1 Tax=Streptomyces sp. NPDC058307 TaxID=3346439 RepID=UPI0036E62446
MRDLTDLGMAHRLADHADVIARHHFSTAAVGSGIKSDGSPVTEADREIEIVLRSLVRQECPDDAFIGEEFGAHGHGRRRWIIDAVDGTTSFLAGEPEWSTLIAVEEDGRITLGMVSAPALGRRWWAMPDAGSWTGPCPCTPDATAHRLALSEGGSAQNAVIGIWPPPPRLNQQERAVAERLARGVDQVRPPIDWTAAEPTTPAPRKPSTGSGTCHGALLVASGQLDAFLLMRAGPWDIAPLIPIVQEARGTFSDLTGRHRSRAVRPPRAPPATPGHRSPRQMSGTRPRLRSPSADEKDRRAALKMPTGAAFPMPTRDDDGAPPSSTADRISHLTWTVLNRAGVFVLLQASPAGT